ncbi:hypothetical protein DEJ02_14735, partial [Curtobacterium sp. MCLR17_042]
MRTPTDRVDVVRHRLGRLLRAQTVAGACERQGRCRTTSTVSFRVDPATAPGPARPAHARPAP